MAVDTEDPMDRFLNINVDELEESEEAASYDELEEPLWLCLYRSTHQLGAAVYSPMSRCLRVLSTSAAKQPEDAAPDFRLTAALVAQVRPARLIVSARQQRDFVAFVRNLCNDQTRVLESEHVDDSFVGLDSTGRSRRTGANLMASDSTILTGNNNAELHFLPASDFALDSCRSAILDLRLPQEAEDVSEEDHFFFLSGFVNFSHESTVRAAGALLKFSLGRILQDQREDGKDNLVVAIQPLYVEDAVLIDESTFQALQIFPTVKLSNGASSDAKTSLFKLVSEKCVSLMGLKYLRFLLRCPSRCDIIIKQRQEAISFFSRPDNLQLVHSLQTWLKCVRNAPYILKQLATMKANVRDWKALRQTVSSLLMICELSAVKRADRVPILNQLADCAREELHSVNTFLEETFDEEASEQRHRFTVKAGVDSDLDEKRRLHNGVPDLLSKVAEEEIAELPANMNECALVYLPQLGYFLAVKPWIADLDPETDFDDLPSDMHYVFTVDGFPHFKTKRCQELDQEVGDTATDITERETTIMVNLVQYILGNMDQILRPCRYSALLDCLLALALTGMEYNWRRPTMVETSRSTGEGRLRIVDGRHPLQEICSGHTFVPNDTLLGHPKAMILTGPNACGKSVYLKQVALIVYMAHLGSFVPAEQAEIPIMDRILSRIQTRDSVEGGLSAFAVDLNQVSGALRFATGQSLIVMDEFGKGTAEIDGQALMVASVFHLISNISPYLLVSTHFLNVYELLYSISPDSTHLVKHMTLSTECDPGSGRLVYLYKVEPKKRGREQWVEDNQESMACEVALEAGVDQTILLRTKKITQCLFQGLPIVPRTDVYPTDKCLQWAEKFLNTSPEELKEYLQELKKEDF